MFLTSICNHDLYAEEFAVSQMIHNAIAQTSRFTQIKLSQFLTLRVNAWIGVTNQGIFPRWHVRRITAYDCQRRHRTGQYMNGRGHARSR